MEISLSNYFGLFTNTYENVLKTLEIDDDGISWHSDKENYLSERALIIFKLDLLLFEYKQENDPHRLILKGKNALISYLVNNKKIPLGDAKNATLSDALILLSGELRELKVSDEIMSQLKQGDFNFHKYSSWVFVSKYPGYHDDEWDPDLWDRRLLK